MAQKPEWVKQLGDAFLAQPDAVMDSVQRLRAMAQQSGNLQSNEQQKIESETSGGSTVITIAPAQPNVVYVPSYNPSVVYGAWPYVAYPPVYLPPPVGYGYPVGAGLATGLAFGVGIAATARCGAASTGAATDTTISTSTSIATTSSTRIAS